MQSVNNLEANNLPCEQSEHQASRKGNATPDANYVALWHTIVFQLAHQPLHNVIQTRAEAATGHNSYISFCRIEVNCFSGACANSPGGQGHTHLLQHQVTGTAFSLLVCLLSRKPVHMLYRKLETNDGNVMGLA
jgi:hypothetical protein